MAKSMLSMTRRIEYVRSTQTSIRQMYRLAFEACWTRERILSWTKEKIYECDAWGRITATAQCEITGYMEAYRVLHWSKLVWTHCLMMTRIQANDARLRVMSNDDRMQGQYGNIDTAESAHCYAINYRSETRFIPFSEADRAKDVSVNRMTDDEIFDHVRGQQQYANLVPYFSNGTVYLANYYYSE